MVRFFTAVLTAALLLGSCSVAKQVPYFQDLSSDTTLITLQEPVPIVFRPGDKLSILVNSRDPQLMLLFNLPQVQRSILSVINSGSGNMGGTSGTGNGNGLAAYTVDSQGNIEFPVLGKLHLAGMTREQAVDHIRNELITRNLVKDPTITIEYSNLSVAIMGEVNAPGRYAIDKDQLTILEALSMAGDLTIHGKRAKVTVARTDENGQQQFFTVNLNSAHEVYSSPVFYLCQNDVIYVEPNRMRANQATVNGNTWLSSSFWISLASFLVSVGVLIFK